MKPADFLRRLRRLANERDWQAAFTEGANHTKVRLNGRASAVPRHSKDMKTGTYAAILKQLGITRGDMED